MNLKQLHSILADTLRRQAERHGYHMTDAEVRDISANQAQALSVNDHPVYHALVALMDLGQDTQNVFWHERFEGAEQAFRDFAADHADRVELDESMLARLNVLRVAHRESCVEIACLRLDDIPADKPAKDERYEVDQTMWRPSDSDDGDCWDFAECEVTP